MNIEGLNVQIEFIDNGNEKRIAVLDGIKYNAAFFEPGTRDPQWLIQAPNGAFHGPYDWLRYLGIDGKNWKVYVHASSNPDSKGLDDAFNVWVTSTRTFSQDDDGETDSHNPLFEFYDWEGDKWKLTGFQVTMRDLPEPWPVKFILQRI